MPVASSPSTSSLLPNGSTTMADQKIELVRALMSGDNATRRAAEQQYDAAKKAAPGELLQFLLGTACGNAAEPQTIDATVRAMAGVLARRLFVKEDVAALALPSAGAVAAARSGLLSALSTEAEAAVRSKLVHIVGALASLVDDPASQEAPSGKAVCAPWPELVPAIVNLANGGNPHIRAAALLVVANVSEYAPFLMRAGLAAIGQCLASGLNAASEDVRLPPQGYLEHSFDPENEEERNAFKALVPSMLKVLHAALDSGNEAASCEALQALIEIAEESPKLVREQIQLVAQTMATVVGAASLEDETRQLAMEFLVRLAENASGMVRKNKSFVETVLVPLAIGLIAQGTEEDFDAAEWNAAAETAEGSYADADADAEHLSRVGEEAVDRIAIALGGKAVFPALKSHAFSLMQQAADWRKQRAGLLALSLMSEGCGKVMFAEVQQIMAAVLPFFGAGHPEVRRYPGCGPTRCRLC